MGMLLSNLERKKLDDGYKLLVGVDEAGRGPLAGPVVAGAVMIKDFKIVDLLEKEFKLDRIRDSKKILPKKRKNIFEYLKNNSMIEWGVGSADVQEIDRLNILQASFLAWERAIKKISRADFLFFDGRYGLPKVDIPQQSIVDGDEKILVVALASIMAKVWRDELMVKMEEKYPNFSFAQHKGYGTKKHFAELAQFGPTEIHRLSFRPVRKSL